MQFTKTHEDFDDSDNVITITRTFDAVLNGTTLEISETVDGTKKTLSNSTLENKSRWK